MVPEGWKEVTYEDICAVNTRNLATSTPADHELTYLDIGSIPEVGSISQPLERYRFCEAPSRARRRVQDGDVIVSTVRPYLRAFARIKHPPPNLVASTGFAVLTPRNGVSSEFLFQTVCSEEFLAQLKAKMVGSNYPAVNTSDVATATVLLPPFPEQQKIAAILSSIDDVIVATRKVIEQTKRVKQGLLQTLMTRGIGHTRFKKTEVGEIPEAWEVVRLDALGRQGIQTVRSGPFGSSLKGEHFTNSGRPVLTIQSLGEGRIDDEGLFFVGPEKARELEDYEVRKGDLVFSRVADIGRSVVIEDRADGWIISSNLIRLSPDKDRVDPWYLMYCIVGGGPVTRQIERLAGDHGRPVVSSTMLKDLRFPVPPKEEQEEIASRIEAVESYVRRSEDTLGRLDQAKRGLMQDLLTGRVRVPPD